MLKKDDLGRRTNRCSVKFKKAQIRSPFVVAHESLQHEFPDIGVLALKAIA